MAEPAIVQLECVQIAITAERKMPVYGKGGQPVSYSSDATGAQATFVIGALPVTVEVTYDVMGNPSIPELVKKLHALVGEGVRLVADAKAINGVALPQSKAVDTDEGGL